LPPSATPPAGSGGVASYDVDGIGIRDHRAHPAPAPDLPPNIHRPNAHKLSPVVTDAMTRQIDQVVAKCAQLLPAGASDEKSRVEGEIFLSIKDGQATVTKAAMQLRDTTGDVDQARRCLEQQAVGLTAHAGDEPDLVDYPIHLSLLLAAAAPGP
jgi:hypothetical protein